MELQTTLNFSNQNELKWKLLDRSILLFPFFIFGLFGAGCTSSGHLITESSRSMREIRAAIIAIAGQPRKENPNRRVFLSTYFPRQPDPNFKAERAKERLYAKFQILGDRRPYDIQVEVIVEEKTSDGYEEYGVDDALSDTLAGDLKKELVRIREDRNVVDDFNPFR